MRYRWIAEHQDDYPVTLMRSVQFVSSGHPCLLMLGVQSNFYDGTEQTRR